MTIVKKYINKHGIFIGTTMDGDRVKKLLDGADIVKKELYYFENKSINEPNEKSNTSSNESHNGNPYGQEYLVSLGEKEGEMHYFVEKPSLEYLVDVEELKKVADKHGLRFVGVTPFERWYEIYLKTDPEYLLREEKGEKEFSFLNFSYVFVPK